MLIRSITQNAMYTKFSIRQFPSPEYPYIAFPQKNLAVLDISRFTFCKVDYLVSTKLLFTLKKKYACHSQIRDGDHFSTWPPCHNLSHGIQKKHDFRSIALHTCNMHVGISHQHVLTETRRSALIPFVEVCYFGQVSKLV